MKKKRKTEEMKKMVVSPKDCAAPAVRRISYKGKFLYSAVSSPQDRSKRFTLYFPDIHVQSDTISASLGSIQSHATLNAGKLLVHISTTVYSQVLIYTAE